MAEYIMEAKIRLHIRDVEDDHYEIEDCKVLNFEEC